MSLSFRADLTGNLSGALGAAAGRMKTATTNAKVLATATEKLDAIWKDTSQTHEEAAQKLVDLRNRADEYGATLTQQRAAVKAAEVAAKQHGKSLAITGRFMEELVIETQDTTKAISHLDRAMAFQARTGLRVEEAVAKYVETLQGGTGALREFGDRGTQMAAAIDRISDPAERARAAQAGLNQLQQRNTTTIGKLSSKVERAQVRFETWKASMGPLGPMLVNLAAGAVAAATALSVKLAAAALESSKRFIEARRELRELSEQNNAVAQSADDLEQSTDRLGDSWDEWIFKAQGGVRSMKALEVISDSAAEAVGSDDSQGLAGAFLRVGSNGVLAIDTANKVAQSFLSGKSSADNLWPALQIVNDNLVDVEGAADRAASSLRGNLASGFGKARQAAASAAEGFRQAANKLDLFFATGGFGQTEKIKEAFKQGVRDLKEKKKGGGGGGPLAKIDARLDARADRLKEIREEQQLLAEGSLSETNSALKRSEEAWKEAEERIRLYRHELSKTRSRRAAKAIRERIGALKLEAIQLESTTGKLRERQGALEREKTAEVAAKAKEKADKQAAKARLKAARDAKRAEDKEAREAERRHQRLQKNLEKTQRKYDEAGAAALGFAGSVAQSVAGLISGASRLEDFRQNLGSSLGGLLGGVGSSLFGPVGGIVGGFAGELFGGLIGGGGNDRTSDKLDKAAGSLDRAASAFEEEGRRQPDLYVNVSIETTPFDRASEESRRRRRRQRRE